MEKRAFILRIAPSHIDRIQEALKENQIIIGWSKARGLLNEKLTWEEFRNIILNAYSSYQKKTLRSVGSAAGHMWRFIREMKKGDFVVVPCGDKFYVAEIEGEAIYNEKKVNDDTAYRRSVKWLNNKQPISRSLAKSALISRMKIQGTSAEATDLLSEIEECLKTASSKRVPTFQTDLHSRLVKETLEELRSGRMDERRFEKLIEDVLIKLGAKNVEIVPRNLDKGVDICAIFRVAGIFKFKIAVQAKYWQPEPPVSKEVVEQLIKGMEAESADLGMVITTGRFSDEAKKTAEEYEEKVQLIDGEQFAQLIVENGISPS